MPVVDTKASALLGCPSPTIATASDFSPLLLNLALLPCVACAQDGLLPSLGELKWQPGVYKVGCVSLRRAVQAARA